MVESMDSASLRFSSTAVARSLILFIAPKNWMRYVQQVCTPSLQAHLGLTSDFSQWGIRLGRNPWRYVRLFEALPGLWPMPEPQTFAYR